MQQNNLSVATKSEVLDLKSDGTLLSGANLKRVQILSLFLLHSLLSFD